MLCCGRENVNRYETTATQLVQMVNTAVFVSDVCRTTIAVKSG